VKGINAMKKLFFLTIIFMMSPTIADAAQKSIVCSMQDMATSISFIVPSKEGDLPKIDFPYPVNTTIFDQSATNLLVVAMDHDESSRPRIFISAKYNKRSHAYEGQFMTDFGGNQIQLDNGAVSCKMS
jgi:hypothetical protein